MEDKHLTFQENLAAYALGALDPEETVALESHMQTCEACRAELADYRTVSSGLLAAMPARPPRSTVRRNLQKQISGHAAKSRPGFNWSLGQVVFAGLMVTLVGLNVITMLQVYNLRQEQAELLAQRTSEQTAIAMLAYPTTQSLPFDQNGIAGSLLVDKQRNLLAVFAWNLPSAPGGKTYQMWLIDPNGDRTSGGFITPEANYPFVMAVVRSAKPLTDYVGFGVTVEPAGGSPKPTGPRIMRVDF
ncbi:MAG TPA: anti-sigma factor [Anaerolineales bacterium]|nr:anti-sigma factor [Anaerolineales bacterium]